jgi:large subunit ribosomal protein L35Ae
MYAMEGTIVHFRGSRRVKHHYQMIIEAKGVDSLDEASKLIGKKVVWQTSAGKKLNGEVTNTHGGKGALRVQFETGMPGQSLGTKVTID